MKPTLIDRLLIAYFTARINIYRRFTGGTPVTKDEHDRQRDLVRASELRSTDKTEAHAIYPLRRTTSGWTNGPVIRTTITDRKARP